MDVLLTDCCLGDGIFSANNSILKLSGTESRSNLESSAYEMAGKDINTCIIVKYLMHELCNLAKLNVVLISLIILKFVIKEILNEY